MRYLDLPFLVDPSAVDEPSISAPSPPELARVLAEAKARDVAGRHPDGVVIGADTLVDLHGLVLNKPTDADDALRMLRMLSGNIHQVHTGIAVCIGTHCVSGVVSASVHMHRRSEEQLRRYVATGEPLDKAGAYAAQGEGAAFIEHVEGSFLAVVGLPLVALRDLLADVGVHSPASPAELEALDKGLSA